MLYRWVGETPLYRISAPKATALHAVAALFPRCPDCDLPAAVQALYRLRATETEAHCKLLVGCPAGCDWQEPWYGSVRFTVEADPENERTSA